MEKNKVIAAMIKLNKVKFTNADGDNVPLLDEEHRFDIDEQKKKSFEDVKESYLTTIENVMDSQGEDVIPSEFGELYNAISKEDAVPATPKEPKKKAEEKKEDKKKTETKPTKKEEEKTMAKVNGKKKEEVKKPAAKKTREKNELGSAVGTRADKLDQMLIKGATADAMAKKEAVSVAYVKGHIRNAEKKGFKIKEEKGVYKVTNPGKRE